MRPPDEMMAMPPRQVRNGLVTDRTETVLLLPQVQHFTSPLEIVCHGDAEALFKVAFPSRIKRIGGAFDLCVSLDGDTRCGEQPGGPGASIFARSLAAKDPAAPVDDVEVGIFNPAPGLLWVPAFCPLPQGKEDGVIHFGQGLLAGHVPVIVGPAPDEGVELPDQIGGRSLGIGLDEGADFFQDGVYTLA